MSRINLIELLPYIDPATCSYEEWLQVGMGLQAEGFPLEAWDGWSQNDPQRYHPGECARKWAGFRGNPNPITGATITQMAKANGWHSQKKESRELAWDDVITEDPDKGVLVNSNLLTGKKFFEPGSSWKPVQEMIKFLSTLYDYNDRICYVTESTQQDERAGKYIPANAGHWDRTAGEIIKSLEKCNGDITNALGDYDHNAGVWIRINPLDGKGVKNDDVTDFKYALVESDSLSLEKQNEAIRILQLPVATLVYSGGKSLHALVRIDAKDMVEYRQRVEFLYKVCQKNGLQIDQQNRNPSRLSRIPGCWRGDHKQFLVDTNIGKQSWEEWKEWFETVNDDLPNPEDLADVWDNMPELADPLIGGVLRQGHKMLIAGPSKAGKSFALIELTIAIANGTKWLGSFDCAQGRVLYVNLELDRASCLHRFRDVYRALQLPTNNLGNIDIWNLRGKAIPMDKLAPRLIMRAANKKYMAVIIDPIYKVITGDENSADQMAHFCNQFDKICTELGCAVIYCHHHSKGNQGFKKSMDRASGSGVFARDPDAMLDMIQLRVKNQDPDDISTAWRIDGTLREFPKFPPVNVFFQYPIHIPDASGLLAMAAEEGSIETIREDGRKEGNKAQTENRKNRVEQIPAAFDCCVDESGKANLEDVAEYLKISVKTLKRYLKGNEEFIMANGFLVPNGYQESLENDNNTN